MGRVRIHANPNEPLPKGLNKHGAVFRARRLGGPWQTFGRDYVAAIAAFKAWQQSKSEPRTVGELLDTCVGRVWPDKVKAKQMAPRTLRDYTTDVEILKKGLGHIPLKSLEPKHIGKFRETREITNPVHVRNEMACLSSALAWAVVPAGLVPTNVCKEVPRPRKSIRDRLIQHDEYLSVFAVAGPSVRLAMALAVRTLGLPADVLAMGPRNIVRYDDGRRTLRFARGKTGIKVEIEIVGDLAEALRPFLDNPTLHPTFIRTTHGPRGQRGLPYTVDGIGAMFRRCCAKVGVKDFGLRDLRAKGATDMYRADPNNIRRIQLLLGHASVQTTEIYIKGLLAEIVRPNETPIVAVVR